MLRRALSAVSTAWWFRGRGSSTTRPEPTGDFSPTPTPCVPSTCAPNRDSELRADSSICSGDKPPSTAELYEALKQAFPNHEQLFPLKFAWGCGCTFVYEGEPDLLKLVGFPGCSKLEHFLTRVYLAIWDFHQVEETTAQERWVGVEDQVLRYNQFSVERTEALAADLFRAGEVLLGCGVRLPKMSS